MNHDTAISIVTRRIVERLRPETGRVFLVAPPGFAKSSIRDALLRTNEGPQISCTRFYDPMENPEADVVLEWGDLQVSGEETFELAAAAGISRGQAADIHRISNGWPAYVDVLIDTCSASGRVASATTPLRGPQFDALVHRCVSELSERELEVFAQLAHFDRFSHRMLASLDDEVDLRDVASKGIPIVASDAGWYEIAEPIRSYLMNGRPLSPQTSDSIAPVLLDEAGVIGAARMFVRAGEAQAAAAVIRQTSVTTIEESDLDESAALLQLVTDLVKDDGSLHIRLSRVLHLQGNLENAQHALRRASALAADQLRTEIQLQADVELLLMQLPEIAPTTAAARHEELCKRAEDTDATSLRVRLREIEALITGHLGDLPSVYRSAAMFKSVAREWTMLREPTRAASALRLLTAAPLMHLGKYTDGREAMEAACELATASPRSLGMSRELLGRMCALGAELERFDEIHPEIEATLKDVGDGWRKAYHAWSQMIASSLRGDASEVKFLHRAARSQLGDLLNHPTAAVFFAESATAMAVVGDSAALTVLNEATSRATGSPLDVALAQISVHALVGDPALVAGLASNARSTLEVPAERDWRISLDTLTAEARLDHTPPAPASISAIREEAARLDLGNLADALINARTPQRDHQVVQIRVLGRFAVCVDGQPSQLPPGHVSDLVKLLAVRTRPLPIDVVIDHLWPDSSRDVGRRRLKNVISRVRSRLGADAIDRTSETVALGELVHVDLREFHDSAENRGAGEAVDLYAGALLPEDLYDDWIGPTRQSVAERALGLALQAIEHESKDPRWLIRALRRIDPPTEEAWLDAAQFAIDHNDLVCARDGLAAAADKIEELGVHTPQRMTDLKARLRS